MAASEPRGIDRTMIRRRTSWLTVAAVLLLPALATAQPPLASGELRILGAQLVVSPAKRPAPKNQPGGTR